MKLIDTHAHLNFEAFGNDLNKVMERASNAGLANIINVGSNFETSKQAIELADHYKLTAKSPARAGTRKRRDFQLNAAVGLHPIHLDKDVVETAVFDGKINSFVTRKEIFNYDKYKNLAQSSARVRAIGETGLDYFRLEGDINKVKQLQKKVLAEHFRLAKGLDLPLILHCRDGDGESLRAYDDMLIILNSLFFIHNSRKSGVIHCFGGDLEQAQKFIELGFYIGITGIVTFSNARELQAIVREIPLNNILIETDSPFLAPVPYRGQKNEPAYVTEVARKIAEIKNISLPTVATQTTSNAIQLFNLGS